jgi:general secretion pathway protein I
MTRAITPRIGRHAGFTLVEVLVAVAIVAIALGAGMRAAGALTDNAQRLAAVTAAQWCADNHLAGMRLARQFPNVGESDFECVQVGLTYQGKLTVVATPNPSFRRVTAQVLDAEGPIYSLSTVLGRQSR